MCLVQNYKMTIKIAEEDIICYKIVERVENRPHIFISTTQKFRYISGIMYQVRSLKQKNDDLFYSYADSYVLRFLNMYDTVYSISEGFHSCATIERAIILAEKSFSKCMVKCIIPKGAKYVTDDHGLLVSTKIKILGVCA